VSRWLFIARIVALSARSRQDYPSDRRGPLDVFALWPCHADPLKTISEPAGPHAKNPWLHYSS